MKHLLSLSILSLCFLLSACNVRVGPSSSHTMNFDQYLGLTLDGKISKVTITDQCVTFEQPFPHMGRHAFYYPFVDGLPYLPKLENTLKAAKDAGHTITVIDERVELPSGRQK